MIGRHEVVLIVVGVGDVGKDKIVAKVDRCMVIMVMSGVAIAYRFGD